MDLDDYRVRGAGGAKLSGYEPDDNGGLERSEAEAELPGLLSRMQDLQERLYAERTRSLLLILQGRDASGKDGTIKHVAGGFNPLGTHVMAFKAPNELERSHDFLWRIHHHVPPAGQVAIFNRSHYEDILVPTVEKLLPKHVVEPRYDHVRRFEELLHDAGTCVLKFFLHISKDEQRKRLQERLDSPDKHWKFDPHDLKARAAWDDFTGVYQQIFVRTSSDDAPWYIIPADRKWFRNYLVARIVVRTLERMDLEYPKSPPGLAGTTIV
ncbi:polyphosphate kinase 2 family protein [Nannocystis sp. ILAH1]|uniref:PPK2 family polyphosphate kinase n=1 Tax=unclassified Nannocystis TaxID=2627009 RepID=UPI002271F6C2|nr:MULTISPECIES: PPK2 family polyphosphate kinase [unclassified Nannocystis]MCY0992859.1 polyphosphate kinase 2 family protein [Nannocystis sp. ILAH1]MCY1066303.1 polyphosphate kinase 2 family protein [Nannocystis sp. RBIL2]